MSAPMEKVGGFIRGSFKLTRERTTHIFGRFMFVSQDILIFKKLHEMTMNDVLYV
jgi:hypothetical protein